MSHAAAVFREKFRRKQIWRYDFFYAFADAINIRRVLRIVDIPTTAVRPGAERYEKKRAFFDFLRQAIGRRVC